MDYIDLSLLDKNDIKFKIDLPNYGIEDGYVLLNRQFWVRDDQINYLIKIDLPSNCESYNELSAYNIAKCFGLNCIEYEVVPIIVNGVLTRASKCESFLNKYEHTISLYELAYDLGIDFRNLTRESLNSLCVHISNKTNIPKLEIYNYFLNIAVFDYLIANNDRHLANVSFIQGLGYYRLAPIYDNGCAFLNPATRTYQNNLVLNDEAIENILKHKENTDTSVFGNLSIFGKVAINQLANDFYKRSNNLKDLYELKDTKIDANHLRLVEYRFKEILGK